MDLSIDGIAMLRNFLYGVCGLHGLYSPVHREQLAISYINEVVGPSKKVLCLVSGGVDSSVCAALINKAVGPERLICLHIDHGFMRHDESATVVKALSALGVPIEVLDASSTFACATTDIKGARTGELQHTVSPEDKRKIIGDTFMVVTQQLCEKKGLQAADVFLAQGTLRPDLIESARWTPRHASAHHGARPSSHRYAAPGPDRVGSMDSEARKCSPRRAPLFPQVRCAQT